MLDRGTSVEEQPVLYASEKVPFSMAQNRGTTGILFAGGKVH